MTRVEETLKSIEQEILEKTGASLPTSRLATIPFGQLLMFLDQNDIELGIVDDDDDDGDDDTAQQEQEDGIPPEIKAIMEALGIKSATVLEVGIRTEGSCDVCAKKDNCQLAMNLQRARDKVSQLPPPPAHILALLKSIKPIIEMSKSLGVEAPKIPPFIQACIERFCP